MEKMHHKLQTRRQYPSRRPKEPVIPGYSAEDEFLKKEKKATS